MTDLDALDRAFLKGSGVPSLPNKGKSAVVDPLDAAFMRGLGQSPIAEVANTPRRVPFTPTPVSPLAMAGAIIRGAGEGLAQGARDLGVTAGKSIIGVGETAVGLVDIASAPVQAIFSKLSTGRVQLGQVGKMLEDIGVDFKTTQDILSTLYSDEQKQALQNVSEKKSAKEKLVALGANPTVPIHSVLQSIPSMMAAASVSAPLAERGMAKWLAGALGEGAVQASSAQEQYRQQSDTGYTTPKQTSLAVASGLVTAAIAAASGKISEKIGLEDVESIGASGSSRGSNLEFWRKLVGGMFMEGPVEEGFQSSTEKIAENLALGRPWDEGVEGAYTEGSVSGAIMGAAANALPSKGKSKSAPKLDADAWIKENADMLPTIAAKEKLGRKYWEKLGLPRVPEAVRAAFLQKVKDTVAEPKFPKDTVAEPKFPEPGSVLPQTAKDALLPKPSGLELPLNEETKARIQKVRAEVQAELDAPTEAEAEANKPAETPVVAEAESVAERKKGKRFPKAPVPEANAAVDEVQAELNAQAAEDAADEAAYALFGKREAKTPVPAATATPVEPEATVPTDTAAEVVKPVEAPVVAEAKAVEERKKGKRVPKAPKPVNKGKGVVEPVVEAPVVKGSLSTPVEQPTTREVKTGLKGQTKTVPVEIPTNGEPTTTIVGRMDMAEFERMGYEPDEVTRQNWVDLQRAERRRLGQREEGDNPNAPWAEYEEFHRDSVKRSLAKGDVVDERVLADYPELQTREVKTGRKGVTKKAGGESVLPSAANAEQAETIEGRFIKQLPSGRWVVQSEENRQRAERGEREIGGDRLFASREEAVKETKLEIEIDRRNAALKATEAAAQAEREAAAAKREAPLNAYLDTITTTPLQRGKLKTTLSKQVARRVSSTGKVYSGSKFEVVNQMVGDGFKADAVEVDAIKDVSRVQWNRMDERQQREWDARRKAAGKKTEYRLVGADKSYYVVTKVEHDLAKAVETSSSPTARLAVKKLLKQEVAKAKAEGNDIELVDTVSDLPADVRSQLRPDTSNIEGFYVNGKTYIIGENVTPDRAEAVVREEMAHRKLDTAQGEELIDGFKKRMTEKDRKALIKEGYTKTQGESDADYEARLANEFIAKQARKNTSAWTEFVDSVKSFLERVGVRDLTSEEAARVILRKLRGGAATGKGVRYSLRDQDAAYMDAVNSGDMEKAQRMVYEAAKKAAYMSDSDYRMRHRAPDRWDDVSLVNLRESRLVPDDYWTKPEWYQHAKSEWASWRSVTAAMRKMDAAISRGEDPGAVTITMYRAVPKTVTENSFRNGDWVTPSRLDAEAEGQMIPEGYRIISKAVPVKDLYWDGNSINEWGYDDGQQYGYQNTPNNRKLLDAVTYDDSGRVVPLSERFNEKINDPRYSLTPAAELDEAKYESAKGIFGTKLERLGEAGFRKWVSEKLPDSAMPYAERFLSERSAMATVPKKKFVTGISRKVVDAELESMGQTPSEGGGQPSWPQLMAQAKADIKANSSAGDSLVANLIENPHPLTQEEIALLNLTKVQRWNEQVAAYESKDKKRLDAAVKRMDEVYFVSALGPDKSKSMQGAALNALKMMTDEKYELVNLVQSHYATTGDVAKPGSQVYKDLEAIAQQYKERTEVLERENARLQEEATTMNQSLADALAQAAYNQGKPKSKGKSKASKIASVADVISKKSRDYGISLIEQARKEQAALNMRASAGVDPARLLMLSKFAAGHILLGVSDVAAKVSEFYGSKISSAEMSQIMSEAKRIAADATSRIAKEAESETLASRVIPKGKGAKTATQLSEVSLKDMFREQAENGVKTFKEALPLVGKLVRDSGINATDLQIQDTYSSYINEPGVLSTDTIKKVIAAYRQEAQLLSKINDAKKGVRPHKIGIPRFPSSQEARALEKELDDLMKNVTFSGDKKPTDIASPLDAKKTWMQNEIDDLEKAIALHEERFQGEKGITDQGDIEYQRLKAQLEDARKRYDEAFPKKPLTQEEQLAILIKQEEKNVDRWNKRVADAKSGKFKSYERVQRPYSERLAELQYQRDNAKAEVARLYELQNPGKRAREAQMKRDLAAIKEMNRRMAAGDYTTPTTTTMDLSGDPDAMAAHLAREQTKKTYEQYKARAAWNKMSKARRIAELAKNVLMSDKAIVYSGDDSFVGRQGWFFAMTHMAEWVKSTGKGLTALDTAKSATMVQEIKESDLYKSGVYKAAGININVKDATGNFSTTDDVNLDVADKIPVLGKVAKVSGRLFGANANLMRTNFLRVVLEGSETGRKILANPYELTEKQKDFLKHVGWGVNVFTGFSNNETIKAGVLLGAPNWCLSVLENLTQAPVLNALLNGDFDAAWQLEKQYGRFYLATAALIAALSMLPSGPKDDEGKRKRNKVILDPRGNRFGIGYIPYTSIQFNTFGPLAPWVRFLGRNISGQKVSGGRVTNLRNTWLFFATDEEKAQAVPYKEGQMMDNLNFLRSKFRPLVSAAIGFQTGTDYYGNEVPRSRVLVESVSPLVPLHLIDNLVRVSPEQAAFESFMEFLGVDSKPDFNTPQYKKYEAKMKVVDEMFKLKFKDENGKSFGDRAEDIYIANAMKTLHRATDTDSSLGLQESAKMMIDDLGLDACLMLLEYQALDVRRQRSGGKISTEPLSERTSSGELSAYGKRVQKLRIISAQ